MRENKGHSDARPSEKMGAKTPASENKPILSEALSKTREKIMTQRSPKNKNKHSNLRV
jgi:hypothetical protein